MSKILYQWFLAMDSFRFCETYLLQIKLFVGDWSAISPFLGGESWQRLFFMNNITYS